jgi:NAD(P)-dependent dehydrogenase (short-subunit alcohol dehydrogenase family)
MALLLKDRHILVNGIAPGFFPSKMANGLMELSGGVEALAKGSPNGRLGNAEDIAATVVWLCSRGGSHVNAGTIVLDGGKMWDHSKL